MTTRESHSQSLLVEFVGAAGAGKTVRRVARGKPGDKLDRASVEAVVDLDGDGLDDAAGQVVAAVLEEYSRRRHLRQPPPLATDRVKAAAGK